MCGANLQQAQVEGAEFSDANLERADLTGVIGKRAIFIAARLSDVNFTDANLKRANLDRAVVNRNTVFTNCNLRYATLDNVENLTESQLRACLSVKHATGDANTNLIIAVLNAERSQAKYEINNVYYPLHVMSDRVFANAFGYLVGFEWVFDLSADQEGRPIELPEISCPADRFGCEVERVTHMVNCWNFWALPFNYVARNLGKVVGYGLMAPFVTCNAIGVKSYYGGRNLYARYYYQDGGIPRVPIRVEEVPCALGEGSPLLVRYPGAQVGAPHVYNIHFQ